MIKFGPSGRDSTMDKIPLIDMPKFIKENNLELYEYSFGRGVNMYTETALKLKDEIQKNMVEFSVHAPYFINFATFDEEKAINNHRYIFDSLKKLKMLNGERCVFHPGSLAKRTYQEALDKLLYRVNKLIEEKNTSEFADLYLCAETMGKVGQIGTMDDIIKICKIDEKIIPCIDFGHVNARENGKFFNKHDYIDFLSKFIDGVGFEKIINVHVHFSKIEYSKAGEVRHLTFEDTKYGPPFEPFIESVIELKISPHIICESAGTQLKDILSMKNFYLENIKNV